MAHAQSGLTKDQTAAISGKVTLKKKALAGVVVCAVDSNDNSDLRAPRRRAITDEEGNYRVSNLPAGNYYVYPMALALVVENGPPQQQVVVAAGETIRDIDFTLVQGGVITGRITGADGQPLIDETVNVSRMDQQVELSPVRVNTDDRGIYRAFGLRRGQYRVSVGKTDRVPPGQMQRIYRRTYYPSVTEPEKATILDVSEASEISDVDIARGPPVSTFKATGRIIESETGKPVPDVTFSVARIEGNMTFSSVGATGSDKHGEFRVENLIQGKYQLFPFSETSNWRAETLTFDVVDRDLTGLEIKTQRAASLSGIVVVKDYDEKSIATKFDRFEVFAFVDNPSVQYGGGRAARLRPDGSFMIVGLASGNGRLGISEAEHGELQQLTIVSIERNGVPVTAGIDLKEGDQVEGIKIFVKSNSVTGVIRGQIKLENGEPLPIASFSVNVARLDEAPTPLNMKMPLPNPQVDSRGRFMVQGLAAGTYEISVRMYKPSDRTFEVTRQQVTVTTGAVSEATVTIKPKP